MLDFVAVDNVSFAFGVELTRLLLIRLFGAVGTVHDVVVNTAQGQACVSFADPTYLQEAMLRYNGLLFLGQPLRLQVTAPPTCSIAGHYVTLRPTTMLYVQRASFLWVKVRLRCVRGVVSMTSMALDACLIHTDTTATARTVKAVLTAHSYHRRDKTVVHFLQRLP